MIIGLCNLIFRMKRGNRISQVAVRLVWNDIVQRKIPLDWDVSMLKNECSILLGGTPSTDNKNYWENGEIHWLNSGEVADFPIVTSEKMITQEGLNESSTILAPKGSVTLSITRYLRISILAIDACINQSVIAIRESCKLKNYYLYPFLVRAVPRFMKLRTGAQQPHINKETVEKSPIIIPTNEILDKYYEIISNVYETIINNALEIQKLTKLRDELLPLLMNGQVSVNYDLSVMF
jgi:type I restriction enzyme S subunit